MRILLVKPYNLTDHIQPSLGLGYLATSIRGEKHNVNILDCIKDNVSADTLPGYIRMFNPDVLGMQCYTFHLDFVKRGFEAARNINPDIINIIGGPHPSAVPEEAMEYFGKLVDFAFHGEAERGLKLLLDAIENGSSDCGSLLHNIPGLIWRDNDKVIINDRAFVDDLDNLGMPAWDIIRPEEYPEAQHGAFYKRFPIAPIMTTRGCPYECTFCAGNLISGRKLRKRSVANVLKEISFLYHKHGIREFHIIDDNFTLDTNYAKALIKGFIGLDFDFTWATPNGIRIDRIDEELLELMRKSGIYLVSLGLESGSDKVLQAMKKRITVDKIIQSTSMIRKAKIDMAGFFILGFPGETREDIKKTINLSLRLGLRRANYFTYLPFPGTESFNMLARSGELKNVDWSRFYFMTAAYSPNGISHKELKRLQQMAFLRFYLRPGIFLKNLADIKSLRHLFYLIRRFFHWLIM